MIGKLASRARRARGLDATERNLIWIANSPRSGSTWLLNLLGREPRVVMVDEPHIGLHMAPWSAEVLRARYEDFEPDRQLFHQMRADAGDYFFAEQFRGEWGPALREMVLARFAAHAERFGHGAADRMVCVKEPNGAQGLGLLISITPRSRVLHLVRDPRDVVVSHLDAYSKGSWFSKDFSVDLEVISRADRIREFAMKWRVRAEVAVTAYEAHDPALRHFVRYEDLRADPLPQTTAIYEWLGLSTSGVASAVEATAFEKLPKELTGAGKFARRAQPGEYKEALSAEEQALVAGICGPMMQQLGYER